jgi:hypothetical protein
MDTPAVVDTVCRQLLTPAWLRRYDAYGFASPSHMFATLRALCRAVADELWRCVARPALRGVSSARPCAAPSPRASS